MITYMSAGSLDRDVQDFFCEGKKGPNVMIEANPNLSTGEVKILDPEGDGWADAQVRELNPDTVILALAKVNGVSPEAIKLIIH